MKATIVFKNSNKKQVVFNTPVFIANYICDRNTFITRALVLLLNNKYSPIDFIIFG